MAWRIDEHVTRGEIDNRVRDRVTGRIWFAGRDEPVEFDLAGNAWRDLAGRRLEFVNPDPKPGLPDGFSARQGGSVGDITASRKVKVPDVSMDEVMKCFEARKPFPWHWGNSLYFEWFSETNGRVVIESATYRLIVSPDSTWDMTPAEESAQQASNGQAMTGFMDRLASAATPTGDGADDLGDANDAYAAYEDRSFAEETAAWADNDDGAEDGADDGRGVMSEEEAERLQAESDMLVDRVMARLEREGDGANYASILQEELERARRERGEPDLTPEEQAERERWVDEMNAAAEAALDGDDDDGDGAEAWSDADDIGAGGGDFADHLDDKHPLAERAFALTLRVLHDVEEHGWIPEQAGAEHPAVELVSGVSKAGAKLAGALNGRQWPPALEFTAGTIVRLKRAAGYLEDMRIAAECCRADALVDPEWLADIMREADTIVAGVTSIIADLRARLEQGFE